MFGLRDLPGGRVDLTWAQWHALSPGVYAAVTVPGSRWDRALAALGALGKGVRVASAGWLPALPALRGVSLRTLPDYYAGCATKCYSLRCQPYIDCPMHYCIPCHKWIAGFGPGQGDPVNLATGEEEYTPPADLTVYNPSGPSVVWSRVYDSLDTHSLSYSDLGEPTNTDFGYGWSQTYNVGVEGYGPPSYPVYVYFSNYGRTQITQPLATTASNPRVVCTVPPGTPFQVEADYDTSPGGQHYTVTFPDRTRWVTAGVTSSYRCPIMHLIDRNGNAINFTYDTNGNLSTITDSAGSALLTEVNPSVRTTR